jgi:hypothetical protein
MQEWTENDFDDLSWHDCHVHAWGLRGAEHGQGTLTLDIDFITAWEQPGDGSFVFQVAPATLRFFDVSDLKVSVDLGGLETAPFPILGIERELRTRHGEYRDYRYSVRVGDVAGGQIGFSGHRFRQVLRAAPIRTRSQRLAPETRVSLIGDG